MHDQKIHEIYLSGWKTVLVTLSHPLSLWGTYRNVILSLTSLLMVSRVFSSFAYQLGSLIAVLLGLQQSLFPPVCPGRKEHHLNVRSSSKVSKILFQQKKMLFLGFCIFHLALHQIYTGYPEGNELPMDFFLVRFACQPLHSPYVKSMLSETEENSFLQISLLW